MKKTQVALAALALVASSAALAEVTVYGRVDLSVQKESGGKMSMGGEGNWDTSVFGLKGSEDLGSGLKAAFNLETGLDAANGAISNRGTNGFFARLANVSLSSEGAGTLTAGTQLSPFIAAALNGVANNNESFYVPLLILAGNRTAQPFGVGGADYGTGVLAASTTGGALTSGFFIPNSVSYTTPTIAGFNASALTQLKNGDAENKYNAYRVGYAAGPLSAAFGYHKRGNATTDQGYDTSTITVGYQVMDGLRVSGGYHSHKVLADDTKTKSYNIGASYNVLEGTAVSLQYARNDATDASSITNVGLIHNLSKRTYAYATVSRATNGAATTYGLRGNGLDGVGTRTSTGDATGYAVGIGHSF